MTYIGSFGCINTHMKTSHATILASATLVVGLLLGGWTVSRFHVRYTGLSAVADANLTTASLKALRKGDTTNAMELLEIRLGGALAILKPFVIEKPEGQRDELYSKVLGTVDAYRAEFPRGSR